MSEKRCDHSTQVISVIESDGTLFRCGVCGAGSKGYSPLVAKGGRSRTLQWDDSGSRQKHTLGDCLDEAKKTICGERQDVYGSPEDSFALVASYWNIYLKELQKNLLVKMGANLADYTLEDLLEAKDIAHMMILFKMARVQGQKEHRDSYVDICGYSSIAADRFGKGV